MKTRPFLKLLIGALTGSLLAGSCHAGEFPAGSPKFVTSYSKLLAAQKATGKPAIIIFSATWCPPCQVMKKSVYPSRRVTPYHDKFIWAYLDADDALNEKAMAKFAVQGIPHIEFLDAAGKSTGNQVGGSSAADFAGQLAAQLAKAAPAPR